MTYKVDNAIIMAAGLSSRFAPISYEKPKALISVKGEVLIERQIRQLQAAGIFNIIIVVGYKKEQFAYLEEKFNVKIVENKEYNTRNNHASIYCVKDYLANSYICSADNYFTINPFESEVDDAYYAAIYQAGETKEWCLTCDDEGVIKDVVVGGCDQWFMMGHVFWNEAFSKRFLEILAKEYDLNQTKDKLWESIYIEHINELHLKIRKYKWEDIFEFDSLDELRMFDETYKTCSHSSILQQCATQLACEEGEFSNFCVLKDEQQMAVGFTFTYQDNKYTYDYATGILAKVVA